MRWPRPAGVRPLSLFRPSASCPALRGPGVLTGLWQERAALCRIGVMMAPHARLPPGGTQPGRRSDHGERVVAELGQDVAGPAGDLAGLGQGGALAVLAGGGEPARAAQPAG